jgi:hypothetical protein
MSRINAYTTQKQGGVSIDIEGMCLDIITILKSTGQNKEQFLKDFSKMWDDCTVLSVVPKSAKN